MSAVLDLCDRWDALSKGQSPTSKAVRAAHAEDLEAVLDIHKPSVDHRAGFDPYCVGCWDAGGMDGAPSYPCATAKALGVEA